MSMDLNEYQAEALKTAIYPLERALDYTVLGLCSEVGEYLDNPTVDELGDVWWYWAAILDALDLKPSELRDYEPADFFEDTGLARVMGEIAGATKKAIRDDGANITTERRAQLLGLLADLRDSLIAEAEDGLALPLSVTLHRNLNKLADRKERGVLQGSGDYR